ncbi:putative HTH-type transcriptional regulator/GBAA_1941/BAS1801 [Planococcus massiliensis]|uniref:Putative HTH-type transcriptional regulator/GBAA_1941/BAS1801 n=1 Tax=Planococcus massiliensis TaxID=1499687 RepID=A0A098EPC1_9BACL|nr:MULTISPECIES: MarR family transcriptional regulator [Planococcus]MCJ1909584.1 MarR family transcriptional regulator [Planococcus ruber]CEG24148.1 putative HTH-type transcriptional regulator/GBAA_1941/BAS1801 [Planococcus massiliensis]
MQKLLFHEIHQKSRLSVKEVNEALKEFDLYSAQWSILFCIKQFGSMTQKEIWQYLNVEAPTITRTVARLEESGWVERKEGADKRERIVFLSDRAKNTVPKIEKRILEVEERLLSLLSEGEQAQLIELLKKIGNAAEYEKDGSND